MLKMSVSAILFFVTHVGLLFGILTLEEIDRRVRRKNNKKTPAFYENEWFKMIAVLGTGAIAHVATNALADHIPWHRLLHDEDETEQGK